MAPKILVVDDEPSIVKLVTASLSGRGYEIFQASTTGRRLSSRPNCTSPTSSCST